MKFQVLQKRHSSHTEQTLPSKEQQAGSQTHVTVLGQSQFAAHTPGTGPASSSALNPKGPVLSSSPFPRRYHQKAPHTHLPDGQMAFRASSPSARRTPHPQGAETPESTLRSKGNAMATLP